MPDVPDEASTDDVIAVITPRADPHTETLAVGVKEQLDELASQIAKLEHLADVVGDVVARLDVLEAGTEPPPAD
ncbi:hypothetical protein ACFRCX_30280 [Streptomyces sp. NPDC056652]|uniref:hypothetical protein n=1 Tax=Streptomyces sp. NPDC056652 TaxID=3345893 RepID=UPI0036AE5606